MNNEDHILKACNSLENSFERIAYTSNMEDVRIELYACERLVQDIRDAVLNTKLEKELSVQYFYCPHLHDLYAIYNNVVYFIDNEDMVNWMDYSHLWEVDEIVGCKDEFVPIGADDPRITIKLEVH